MRIQDLLIETQLDEQQLDELGFAQGLGKVAGGVGKGVGAVQGAWQGAKDAFGAGRAQAAQSVRSAVNGQQPAAVAPAAQATAPADATQQQQIEPTLDTPAAIRNAAAPTSNETDPQNNVTTTNAPAAGKRIGVPQGTQAIDNAMTTVNTVRSDRRQQVIDYAKQAVDSAEQQLAAIRKNAGIKQAVPTDATQQPTDNTVPFKQAAA